MEFVMPIPDFQTLMLPFLEVIRDGREYNIPDVVRGLADRFDLTPEERTRRYPTNPNLMINNIAGWTKTHLKKAGLVENPRHGVVKITDRGLQVLAERPERIDIRFLLQYPEYAAFRDSSRPATTNHDIHTELPAAATVPVAVQPSLTPVEELEQSYQEIRNELADTLLEQISTCSPQFFEQMVIDLLISMGYGGSRQDAGQAIGQSHDEGIDGIIKEDKLGLDAIYIQAKRWNTTQVGRPAVQAFVGSLVGHRAVKGIYITTSDFTREAQEYVRTIDKKVVLINGKELTQLMIDHGIGVTDIQIYTIKRIDTDYFTEE